MTQETECGLSHTHLLTIPTVGDFRLGFEDYEISNEETGQSIKINNGQNRDEIKLLKSLVCTVRIYDIPLTTYQAIESFALADIQNYLVNMQGSVTINLGGKTVTNCVIKGITRGESYFDYDEVQRFDSLELKIENPNSVYF